MEALEAETARLLETGDLQSAAAAIMRGYGPAILGYLAALSRDEDRADDVFSQFSEDLWRGLPAFRRDASVRTRVYKLAWHAWLRQKRKHFAATAALSSPERCRPRRSGPIDDGDWLRKQDS